MNTQGGGNRYSNLQFLLLSLSIFILLFIGCGDSGGGGNTETSDQGPEINAIVISPNAALLTKSGQTEQLTYTAYNNDGNEISVSLEWSSSNPDAVSVDKNGLVKSLADIGSSVITASSKGVESNKVMIVIAETVQGAMIISDDQVVSEIEPENPNDEWELGIRCTVRLSGINLPAAGTILIGAGEKPVGGKVVSAIQDGNEVEVVLELVTIEEMFTNLVIQEEIDLSQEIPTIAKTFADNYDVSRHSDRSWEFTPRAQISTLSQNAMGSFFYPTSLLNQNANYGPFECTAGFSNPLVLDLFSTSYLIFYGLDFDIDYHLLNGGLQHILLKGEIKGTFKGAHKLSAEINGNITCKTILGEVPIPIPGALRPFISGFIPLGLGFGLDGKITMAQVGFEFTAEAKAEIETGWQCSDRPECDMVGDIDPSVDTHHKWLVPATSSTLAALSQMRMEPKLSGFIFSGFEIGVPAPAPGMPAPTIFPRVELLKIEAGITQSGNFAIVEGQMDDDTYSSDYAVSIGATIEPGLRLYDPFFGLLQANLGKKTFTIQPITLGESPKARSITADKNEYQENDDVKFTVELDPQSLTYPMYGYTPLYQPNVYKILIYRHNTGPNGEIEAADLLVEKVVTPGQTNVELTWTADEDASTDNFYAFVETVAWPFSYFGQLEIGKIGLTNNYECSYLGGTDSTGSGSYTASCIDSITGHKIETTHIFTMGDSMLVKDTIHISKYIDDAIVRKTIWQNDSNFHMNVKCIEKGSGWTVYSASEPGRRELFTGSIPTRWPATYSNLSGSTECWPDYSNITGCGTYACPYPGSITPSIPFPGDCHQWWDHEDGNGIMVMCNY